MKLKYLDQLRKKTKYCFFMIAKPLADRVTAACSSDIKNNNHKELATKTRIQAMKPFTTAIQAPV